MLINIGCRVNRSEGESLLRFFKEKYPDSEIIVVNTCVVTRTAEARSRKAIRKILRERPDARVIVTGCLQFYQPLFDGVEWLSMTEKEKIANNFYPLTRRSRYYLKIEDGCDRGCHYCVVAKIRGGPRSKPFSKILAEIDYAKEEGFPEIVLVGVNLGLYDGGLERLIRRIGEIPDLPRIRLSSIEPDAITPDLIHALKDIPFCRHLHLALQHTESDVLMAMGRPLVDLDRTFGLINSIDKLNIGSDIIVGYPGETEHDFQEMVQKLKDLPICYLHVFPYSPRPGTKAFQLSDSIPPEIKRGRVKVLRGLSSEKRRSYAKLFLGIQLEVVVEKRNGAFYGLSDNYLKIRLREPVDGDLIMVVPKRIVGDEILS
ncbi:MAG TPA: radical SAM protein [bacterium (Candidatus Stahlbacteria)]|nr:radical SAM protein [Candidatus Stahlbacteria bacterium]